MLLGAHETLLRSAYAVLEGGRSGPPRRRAGVLYLTSARFAFEAAASRGAVRDLLGGRDVEIVLEAPLVSLRNVAVRRGRWSRPRLVVEVGGHRPAFDVLEPEAWSSAIAEAHRRAGEHRSPAGTSPVVKVRCRYCGGLADEQHNRCPSCGAPM